MRTCLILIATILACGGVTKTVKAGVYNTVELDQGVVHRDFRFFQPALIDLRQIGADIDLEKPNPFGNGSKAGKSKEQTPLRKNFLLIASLIPKPPSPAHDSLTAQQRLNLGACLIRLNKFQDAIDVFTIAAKKDRANFLVHANLASAYQLLAEQRPQAKDAKLQPRDALRHAMFTHAEAMSLWPKDWNELNKDQQKWLEELGWKKRLKDVGEKARFDWYREVETYQRKLLNLRNGEGPPLPFKLADNVDALFDDGGKPRRPVRFVGENGAYEAGKLAAKERAKLPQHAIEVVQQMLNWLPEDMRLYWLLGELYNADGDFETALTIFDEIGLKMRFKKDDDFPALLREHRQILRQFKDDAEKKRDNAANSAPQPSKAPRPTKTDAPETPTPFPVDLRTFGVGFLAGLVATLLGLWQLRELRRRRQARETAAGR